MQTSKILIAAIALMAFGGGFGAALLLESGAPAQSARKTAPEPPALAPSQAHAPNIPEPVTTPAPLASSGDFRAHFRAGVQAMPREERERGKGVIEGFVRTETGETLQGVQLQLQATQAPKFHEEEDLVGYLTQVALERRWREAQSHETTTDATGRYRFEDLPDHAFRLTATCEGYVVEPAIGYGGGFAIKRPDAEVDWIAKTARALRFEVVDENGNPLQRATITVSTSDPRSGTRSWPLHTGPVPVTKTLKYGTYTVWANQGDRGLDQSQAATLRITVDANTQGDPVRLIVPQTGTISLRCTLNGRPLASQSLSLAYKLLKTGEEPGPAVLTNFQGTQLGKFLEHPTLLQTLPYGSYVVGLRLQFGRDVTAWRTLEVTKPREDIDWPIVLPSDLSLLEIVARGQKGETVPNLNFRFSFQSESISVSGSLNILFADAGRYTCTPDQKFNGPGRITVTAEHETFGSGTASADWPLTSPLDLQLSAFAALDLHFQGLQASRENSRIEFQLYPVVAGRTEFGRRVRGFRPSDLDEADHISIEKLAAGDYALKLITNETAGRGFSLGQFTLQPGLNRESVLLPGLSRLIVLAAPGLTLPETLTLRPHQESEFERWVLRAFLRDQQVKDRLTFDLVPHGRYFLEGRSKEGNLQILEVQVESDTTFTWSELEFDAIRVTITAENSPLTNAGLADGDLILAVANVAITAENHKQVLFRLMTADAPLALRINRSGSILDITADMTEVRRQSSNLGGRFLPAKR